MIYFFIVPTIIYLGFYFYDKNKDIRILNLKKNIKSKISKIKNKDDLLNFFNFIKSHSFFKDTDLKNIISLYKSNNDLNFEIKIDYMNFILSSIKYKDEYNNDIINIYNKDKLLLSNNDINLETKFLNAIKLILIDFLVINSSNLDSLNLNNNLYTFLSNSNENDVKFDMPLIFMEIEEELLIKDFDFDNNFIINDLLKYTNQNKLNNFIENYEKF